MPLEAHLCSLASEDCPAFGPRACCDVPEVLEQLLRPATVGFDSEVFPFSRLFLEALLVSGTAPLSHNSSTTATQAMAARLRKRECRVAAMCHFQQRLRSLPLELIHLAVDPDCYCGGTGASSLAAAAAPNLKLPKGNISRFVLRRLRPLYHKFICEMVAPDVAAAMHSAGLQCSSVFFQAAPCLRMACPSGMAATHPHCDAMYYHQPGQINYWLPLTHAFGNNSLWVESAPFRLDHAPLDVKCGEVARFYGNRCTHFTVPNDTQHTRITLDFRAVPGCLFQRDYKLSRDRMGRQMFAVGGYYAECRNVNGEWMIVRHRDIGDKACGDAQENKFAPEDQPGVRSNPMRTACACTSCLVLSRWMPERGPPVFDE